ncbi:MAG: AMP-binding protein, partial [Bdellovibrionota bacterium]
MDKTNNLFELFNSCIVNAESRNLVGNIEQGNVSLLSSSHYKSIIESLSLALINIGIKKKTKFGIYLANSIQWHLIDMSIMVTGAICVPFYRDLSMHEFCQQLTYTDCEGVFVENLDIFAEYYESFQKSKLKFIVTLDEGNIRNIPLQIQHIKYNDLLLLGQSLLKSDLQTLRNRANQILPEDIATLVATSGAREDVKFAMLSHRAIINVLTNLENTFMTSFSENDRTLVILPLSHISGRINSLMHLVFHNQTIFCSNLYNLPAQLKAASPTFLIGFPKIIKMLYYTLRRVFFKNKSIFAKNILNWSNLSSDKYFSKIDNELAPTSLEIIKQNVAQRIFFKKIIEFLGGNLKIIISVGGNLSSEVYNLLRNCNILVLEGYCLTEATGLCIINPPYKQ